MSDEKKAKAQESTPLEDASTMAILPEIAAEAETEQSGNSIAQAKSALAPEAAEMEASLPIQTSDDVTEAKQTTTPSPAPDSDPTPTPALSTVAAPVSSTATVTTSPETESAKVTEPEPATVLVTVLPDLTERVSMSEEPVEVTSISAEPAKLSTLLLRSYHNASSHKSPN